jgi:hypothetical protein
LTVYSWEFKETMATHLSDSDETGPIEEIRKRMGSGVPPEDVYRLLIPVVQNLVNPE